MYYTIVNYIIYIFNNTLIMPGLRYYKDSSKKPNVLIYCYLHISKSYLLKTISENNDNISLIDLIISRSVDSDVRTIKNTSEFETYILNTTKTYFRICVCWFEINENSDETININRSKLKDVYSNFFVLNNLEKINDENIIQTNFSFFVTAPFAKKPIVYID